MGLLNKTNYYFKMSGEMPAEMDQPMDRMPMDMDMDKDMRHDDMDKMDKDGMSMGMMDKMMGGPEALLMMIGMTAVTYGLKFTLSVVAILTHVAAMVTEDPMLK